MTITSINVPRKDFFPHVSTAQILVGFLKGIQKGLDPLTATEITDDHLDRLRIALGEAREKAESVAEFLSETVDGDQQ